MLKFPPVIGQVLECDYTTGFVPPEMVKLRLAVVVSPRLPQRDNLCTVVPLSTTPSKSGIEYQCKIVLPFSPPQPFEGEFKFAKADMLATVSYNRLSMPRLCRDRETGKRKYLKIVIAPAEIHKIQRAVLCSLGLKNLTNYLT